MQTLLEAMLFMKNKSFKNIFIPKKNLFKLLDWAIEVNLVQTEIMTNKTKIRYRFLFNIN